ncbi:MAG: tryptophan synthase subunit alpha [Succinivibrio sp.]|nr:tryptophan synthase subunit alpha [Succinivibrio sp.]
MENRFETRFKELEGRHEGAFVPFVTLCDPDYATSFEILKTLLKGGADALELGFPFSDPCADGPVIQKADKRALGSGASVDDMFALVGQLRQSDDKVPVSILVYSNVVVARGVDKFFADAAASGIDAVLVADVPVGMLHTAGDFTQCARKHQVGLVLIAPPNADEQTLQNIAGISQGYTYVLSRFGITGTETAFGKPVRVIARLKELGAPKSLLGFGISKPEHVRQALEIGASGAIAGSACVKIIEKNLGNTEALKNELEAYVRSMKSVTRL